MSSNNSTRANNSSVEGNNINSQQSKPSVKSKKAKSKVALIIAFLAVLIAISALFWPEIIFGAEDGNSKCPLAEELGLNKKIVEVNSAGNLVLEDGSIVPHQVKPGQNPDDCPTMRIKKLQKQNQGTETS
jgi:hypothetical protein